MMTNDEIKQKLLLTHTPEEVKRFAEMYSKVLSWKQNNSTDKITQSEINHEASYWEYISKMM